jgi:hypothetical protein
MYLSFIEMLFCLSLAHQQGLFYLDEVSLFFTVYIFHNFFKISGAYKNTVIIELRHPSDLKNAINFEAGRCQIFFVFSSTNS